MIRSTWKGNLKRSRYLGSPNPALGFWYMYRLAGKTAINKAIIPQAANFVKRGKHKRRPRSSSARPVILFNNTGLGK